MASALDADSDDDELLRPSFATKTFTVTTEMIDSVLSVCPGFSRDSITSDLFYTNNITTTINRILDGRVISGACNQLSALSSVNASDLTTTTCSKDDVVCLSDTDIDTDTENDQDNGNHNQSQQMDIDNDITILETYSPVMHNNLTNLPKKHQKDIHYTSDIIDLSFDDDDQSQVNENHSGQHSKTNTTQSILPKQSVNIQNTKSSTFNMAVDSLKDVIQVEDHNSSDNAFEARTTDISSSDSDSDSLPSVIPSIKERLLSDIDIESSQLTSSQMKSVIPQKKKKYSSEEAQKRKENSQQKKMEKEKEKQAKKEAMLSIRKEKEMEKLLKKAESMNQKSQRKEECLQNIQVCVDPGLLSSKQGMDEDVSPILDKLTSLGVSYNVQSHLISDSITWKRATVMHFVGEDLQIHKAKNLTDEHHVLVRILSDSFITMVDASKKMRSGYSGSDPGLNSFQTFSRMLTEAYPNKCISLVVFGLDKYFRSIKSKTARDYRNKVRCETDSTQNVKSRKNLPASVIVSQIDMEEFLVFVELTTNFKVTLCENVQEFAESVAMFTKAVAEAPFKRSQSEAFSFCVDTSKSSVKVTKDGQGLVKLWQQQLQQFHNVSSNMAAAIVAAYPSPRLLMQAYKDCPNEHSAALLLKDILVRRGTGVLETSRRIGPELSRQVYLLFNSTDGDALTK